MIEGAERLARAGAASSKRARRSGYGSTVTATAAHGLSWRDRAGGFRLRRARRRNGVGRLLSPAASGVIPRATNKSPAAVLR
jgi:hypothetical protein